MSDSYRQTTESNDANFLLGDIAHAGSKRVAPHDAYAPQQDFSSLKTISHKRRRVECPLLLDLVPRTSGYCTPALARFRMLPHPLVKGKEGPSSCFQRELEHRTLVYQATPRLQPLWELGSVSEFSKCYIDILEIHFRAYEHGILRRDMSEETALVHKSDGLAVGCLVDWDLTCAQDNPADGEALRRGTGPFVAIDLQYVGSNGKLQPQHRYYHDLESLFWVLAWALMHFDIPNGRRLDCYCLAGEREHGQKRPSSSRASFTGIAILWGTTFAGFSRLTRTWHSIGLYH
ncbi:uncharacterized protein SCHCODRAFT_02589507 [Schizophyllum commune H4-8]|nr:uncharacterized protein SCHCODRAFT_02589507 [Schizophyllum commune H4-8]KAI5887867.1 hypothetical protein SCHCODRAFT_02589507 [Schizophyllum commune H4-8]